MRKYKSPSTTLAAPWVIRQYPPPIGRNWSFNTGVTIPGGPVPGEGGKQLRGAGGLAEVPWKGGE
eukprot:COSAG02_NODE_52282_length_308_cov_6.885167_1_plen_64_part_01